MEDRPRAAERLLKENGFDIGGDAMSPVTPVYMKGGVDGGDCNLDRRPA